MFRRKQRWASLRVTEGTYLEQGVRTDLCNLKLREEPWEEGARQGRECVQRC